MCGRYELSSHPAAIALAFGLPFPPDLEPRYNIAPTQPVPIVRQSPAGARELVQVRWGLVPRRAKDPSIGVRMINARAETLAARSAFRNAYARHRCLVPANGFYEWQPTRQGRQPVHVGMPDGRPFGLAGLYERWLSPEGEVLDTCTIVTAPASDELRGVHDRMPIIVPEEDYERWLDGSRQDVDDLLAPWSREPLRVYPVSRRVNAVANDDAALCEPVEAFEAAPPSSTGTSVQASAAAGSARPIAETERSARPSPDTDGSASADEIADADEALVHDDPVQPRLL